MSRGLVMDWALTWLFLAQLALILWNQRELGRPLPRLWADDAPLVSVMVPARNEEATIEVCLAEGTADCDGVRACFLRFVEEVVCKL